MIINLTNMSRGDIEYKIIDFPDGQKDIVITGIKKCSGDRISLEEVYNLEETHVIITSRCNSMEDLGLIVTTNSILKDLGVGSVELRIPYILGGRSDRRFVKGGSSYLRNVVAPIINSQNFSKVRVFDPHSDTTEAVIDRLFKKSNYFLVSESIEALGPQESLCLIAPDAGASKKIYDLMSELNFKGDLVIAEKHREVATGKITHTSVPLPDSFKDKKFVIIDDICDGGRTFIEIAKVIKEKFPEAEVSLIVTHGIFSAGFEELYKYFHHIYTTNSVKDIPGGFYKKDKMGNNHWVHTEGWISQTKVI